MLTMLEKVSAFKDVSRVSKSHLGSEDIFLNEKYDILPSVVLETFRKLAVLSLA